MRSVGLVAASRARRGSARGGAEGCTAPASGWGVCTGSGGAQTAAPALWTLAPGGGGLGVAGAGLDALWEAFAGRCVVGATGSDMPYPTRRAPRRFLVFLAARERCGVCLGVPAARRGCLRSNSQLCSYQIKR